MNFREHLAIRSEFWPLWHSVVGIKLGAGGIPHHALAVDECVIVGYRNGRDTGVSFQDPP